ncbi:MAG: hypothetical protein DMD71_02595 [Gemmatimonadetes bacterium]|nr:MAG: hypothetical protein DMD74_00300 [Gemmatimonadota bacterium]PYO70341.1 MAG: hypothetical protein DMD71_02595 [Gemmatimonadota bacterium]PYO83242.1 MAG: hypothetical protein DMD68_09780 [Gemmatimonadota bacterium]
MEQPPLEDFDLPPPPPTPDSITREFLARTPDDALEESLFAYVLSLVKDDISYDSPILRALPEGLRAHFVVSVLDAEVCNGGFAQFFFNSSGQVGPSSAEAFAFFGLPLVADIVEEAMQIHVHRAPRLDGARDQGTIEAFMKTYQDDPFRSVSERYLALSDEIRSARIRHIRAHPELFVHPTGGTA